MRTWGCPTCAHPVGLVQDTGHDPEGYPVRLRACTGCGTLWATEETPIAVAAFYARNASRRRAAARRAKLNRGHRPCLRCGGQYREGRYRDHVGTKGHEQALKPLNRNRRRHRLYQRHWAREKASA